MLRQELMFVLLGAFTEEESFQMFLFNQNSLNYKLFLAAVFVIFLIVSLTLEYSEACQFEVNDDRWSCFMKVLLFPGNVCLGLGNKWLVKTSDNLNFLNNVLVVKLSTVLANSLLNRLYSQKEDLGLEEPDT